MSKKATLNTKIFKVNELKSLSCNPRKALTKDDLAYKQLKKSIEKFDYVDPLIFNTKTNHLISGHQRLTVLKDLGYTEIEVNCVDLDEEKEKSLNIALNKISGEWDETKLLNIIDELEKNDDFVLEEIGFSSFEINSLQDNFKIPDFQPVSIDEVPRLDKKSKIKCPHCGMEFIP